MLDALIAAAVLLVGTAGLGLAWRALDGRRRRGSLEHIRPADVSLDVHAFGPAGTLLQFSSAWCTRCPTTRRVLGDVAARTAGVRHAEVDLTDRPDLASRYGVLQTPTTFVLDGTGALRARIAGAARPSEVAAALVELVEERPPEEKEPVHE